MGATEGSKDETPGGGPFTGIAHRIAWQHQEIERLRKGIQAYLDGNWGESLPSKLDKCPHDRYGWEDCGACIDEYFARLLSCGK